MITGRKGFTLIELLVVIAIIAILAAILFPVFARAKAKALEAQCLSNVKQIATAVLTYASDYDQRLPWAMYIEDTDHPEDATYVFDVMRPYLKTMDILQCPAAPGAVPLDEIPGMGWPSSSYAVNGSWWGKDDLFPTQCSDDSQCQFPTRVGGYWDPYTAGKGMLHGSNLDECDGVGARGEPARQYMVWDAEIVLPDAFSGWTNVCDLDINGYNCDSRGGNASHPALQCGTAEVDVTPVLRHNNGMNVAFFDGHGKRQSEKETEDWSYNYGGRTCGGSGVCGWVQWDWDNY